MTFQTMENNRTCLYSNNATKSVFCFDACQQGCAEAIASTGNLYLSCFLRGCGNHSSLIHPGKNTSFDQLVADSTAVESKLGQPIDFHDTDVFHRGIGVKGKTSFTVDLTKLRSLGFRFDYFSARVGFDSSASDRCTTKRVSVEISTSKVNGTRMRRLKNIRSKEIIYKVGNAPHLRLDMVPGTSHENNCFYGAWADAKLTDGLPLFPSCLSHCYIPALQQNLPLSCFMGTCPGQTVNKKVKDSMKIEKINDHAQLCVDFPCHTHLQQQNNITSRGITMSPGVTIVFNLKEIRQLGYKADILKTRLYLLTNPSCTNTSLPSKQIDFTAKAILDRDKIIHQTSHSIMSKDRTEKEVILDVSQGSRIALSMKDGQQCATALWKNPILTEAKTLSFPSCNGRCQEATKNGNVYLSCFIGTCSGNVAYADKDPFFKLNHQTWGIGVNRPGGWADGSKDITFNGSENITFLYERTAYSVYAGKVTFSFGIGAYSPSSMTFDLNAIREYGFHFNYFSVIIGIDVTSGCETTTGSMFQIYVDDNIPIAYNVPTMDSVQRILVSVQSATKLRLATLNMHGKDCSNAAWAMAKLIQLSPS